MGHVVFALTLLEVHHRDAVLRGVTVDRRHERLADRVGQHRRGERRPPVAGEKRRRARRIGQPRHVQVAVHPVDAVQLEHHMLGQHIRRGQG